MDNRVDLPQDLTSPHFSIHPSLEDLAAVQAVVRDDDVEFDQIAAVMDSRPMIAAMMIKTANSVGLGAVQQVRSLRHALALIGLQRIRHLLDEMKVTAIGDRNRAAS